MEIKKTGQYNQLKHISDATFLEESNHMKLIFKGIFAVFAIIVAFVIWATFATITETTRAMGQLVPEGEVQSVEHLEGGIVTKVLINDGDTVKKGQLLVQLSTGELTAELDQLYSQEVALTLTSERINYFLKNESANKDAWEKVVLASKYNPIETTGRLGKLLNDQERLLKSEYEQLDSKKDALQNTLNTRREKLSELMNQKKIWEQHMLLLVREFEMYKKLQSNHYISQKDYLDVLNSVNEAKGEGSKISSQIEQAKEDIGETENNLRQADSTAREAALEEVSKAHSDLLEVHYKIQKLSEQIARSSVKAPVSGIVKGLNAFAGNVIKPGAVLMEVVPEGEMLFGEVKIMPKEIGYVRKGDEAVVKVMTYDYARFGSIKGQLISVSASTFTEQDGKTYYKARIKLSQQFAGPASAPKVLKAGMTIEADLITGSKTLLEYLLKPIHRSVTESFRER